MSPDGEPRGTVTSSPISRGVAERALGRQRDGVDADLLRRSQAPDRNGESPELYLSGRRPALVDPTPLRPGCFAAPGARADMQGVGTATASEALELHGLTGPRLLGRTAL